MNEVNFPRRYTEEERVILNYFNKLSLDDQTKILAWAERVLEKHVKAVAKENHLHLVRANKGKGGEQRKRPVDVSAPSRPQKNIFNRSIP